MDSDSAKTRILFVAPSLGGGGAERQLLHIANGLNDTEFVKSIFCIRRGGAYEQFLKKEVATTYPETRIKSSTLGTILSLSPLRKTIAEFQPDILVSFLNHTSILCWSALRPVSRKAQLCVCIQNNLSEETLRTTHRFLQPTFWRCFGKTVKSADGLVFISKGVEKDFRQHYPDVRTTPSEVIYNIGTIPQNSSHAESNIAENYGAPIILACGRLHEQKDYPTLLRAFQRVVQKTDARLHILGEGPERTKIEELIGHLGLQSRVSLLGFQSDPAAYMKAARVFVLSSKYEGFGNVIVEAMSLGVPVVSTRCPYGPDEIIQDEVNGLLVPVGNDELLSDAILRVIKDEALHDRLAENALVRCRDFTPETIVPRYEEFFRSLLNRPVCKNGE